MTSIVLAGVGGQGIITLGKILGEAAIQEGKKSLMTEIHGMAQRGGRISVDLRIGDYQSAIIPIGSADAILGFELMETARNTVKLKKDGIIVANKRMIHPMPLIMKAQEYPERESEEIISRYNHYYVNADEIAMSLGEKRSVNMVMLGALFGVGILEISEESLKKTISASFRNPRVSEINIKAFEAGVAAVNQEKVL